MLENATYSVISPESCAAIIWRDATKAPLAAAALKMTASDLIELEIVDGAIPEPEGGAHENYDSTAEAVRQMIRQGLSELANLTPEQLVKQRYDKFRRMGSFFHEATATA
jgi:acetyl-CoA carboxylase carboxyl transferase subunit alpha